MTTAKTQFKRYVYVFGIILSGSLLIMLSAAIYIQPLEGELTRLGSYAERDFGWNLPQKKIMGDANLAQAYQKYSDVLIIGDSFSTNGVWQPFFSRETGLSYLTMDIRKTSFHDLLKSQTFIDYPPKILIVQSVERELLYFFRDLDLPCGEPSNADGKIAVHLRDSSNKAEYYEEVRKTLDICNINLRYAASVMIKTLIRNLFERELRPVKRFHLIKDTLFSNKQNNEILLYDADIDKLTWDREDIAKAICSIQGLQNRIKANGKTLFIFMLAPDKSSAYADYIANPVFRNRENTQDWFAKYGINAPRIDLLLKKAIDSGMKDIYLPSGTHWSARGYEIAAECLVDFIKLHSIKEDKTL
jgi:hypothetical protein